MTPEELKQIKEVQAALKETAEIMFRERITIRDDPDFSLTYEVMVLDGFLGPPPKTEEMRAWCQQQYGPPWDLEVPCKSLWCYDGHGVFNFKNSSDRSMFLLRWS